MTIVIDPSFSVYRLVERLQSTSIHLNHRRTMSLISYEIENATIVDHVPGRVFAGFQRMSKFVPQIDRYRKMAETADEIFVFGVPDIELPAIEHVTYVNLLASDQLAREWFLVTFAPAYTSALVTEEMTRFSSPDDQRVFKGYWTFDRSLVEIIHDWLSSAVDVPQQLWHDQKPEPAAWQSSILGSLARLQSRMDRVTGLVNAAHATMVVAELDAITEELQTHAAQTIQP